MVSHAVFYHNMPIKDRLIYMLRHENEVNALLRGGHGRPFYLTEALGYACDVLPKGRNKRALDYVSRNACAEFHFGGTDAVGPAIMEAIRLLEAEEA